MITEASIPIDWFGFRVPHLVSKRVTRAMMSMITLGTVRFNLSDQFKRRSRTKK